MLTPYNVLYHEVCSTISIVSVHYSVNSLMSWLPPEKRKLYAPYTFIAMIYVLDLVYISRHNFYANLEEKKR